MTCREVAGALVDYLYGDLSHADRAAFENHLRACTACAREMAAMERTRAVARTALRGTLDEAPPQRVRENVLRAATAAASSAASAALAAGKATPGGEDGRVTPAVSWSWDWLRRPWFLPAFAAASLIGIFVLSRNVILNPTAIDSHTAAKEHGRAPTSPVAGADEEAPPVEVSSGEPSPAAPRVSAVAGIEDRRWANPPPPRDPATPAAAAAPEPKAYKPAIGRARVTAEAEYAADRANELVAKKSALEGPRYAAPPRKAEQFAPAARAPAARSLAPSPSPSPAAPAAASLDRAAAAAGAPGLGERSASSRDEDDSPVAATTFDDLVRRAERSFAAEQWADAAASYRELARRFPRHLDASKWRARLAIAERALQRPESDPP